MRLFFAIILTAITAASAANASSIVALQSLDTPVSASMVVLGASQTPPAMPRQQSAETKLEIPLPEPSIARFGGSITVPRNFVALSGSVIAMMDAPQPIAYENVASIGNTKDPRTGRDALPMVIRGGILGDAFVSHSAMSSSSSAPAAPPQQQASAPSSASSGTPSPEPGPKEPEPSQLPKQALPPPAMPTGRVE